MASSESGLGTCSSGLERMSSASSFRIAVSSESGNRDVITSPSVSASVNRRDLGRSHTMGRPTASAKRLTCISSPGSPLRLNTRPMTHPPGLMFTNPLRILLVANSDMNSPDVMMSTASQFPALTGMENPPQTTSPSTSHTR